MAEPGPALSIVDGGDDRALDAGAEHLTGQRQDRDQFATVEGTSRMVVMVLAPRSTAIGEEPAWPADAVARPCQPVGSGTSTGILFGPPSGC